MLKGIFANLKYTGIAQGWSLTVEECFYFTAPFVLISRSNTLVKILLYVVACYAIGLSLTLLGTHINFFGFFGDLNFLFCYTFFGRCLEFAIGMFLAAFMRRNIPLSFKHFTLAGIVGILLLVVCMTYVKGDAEVSKLTTAGVFLNNVCLPIAISALLIGLLREQSLFRRLLETKVFDLLGKSSYTFYLIHMGVLEIFLARYVSSNLLIIFLLINVASIVLFKLIEDPIHGFLKRLGIPKTPAVLASSPALINETT